MPQPLTLADLAAILHTTPTALHVRMHHNKDALPPSFKIPGDRRCFFDPEIVNDWLKSLAQQQHGEVQS